MTAIEEKEPQFILTIFNRDAKKIMSIRFPAEGIKIRTIEDAVRCVDAVERNFGGYGTIRQIPETNGNKKAQAESIKR